MSRPHQINEALGASLQHSIKEKRDLSKEIVKYQQVRQNIADSFNFIPKLQALEQVH